MSHFLVTIGPSLTLSGSVYDLTEGDAASFTFSTFGASGFVTLSLPTSTLPPADWTFTDNADGTATLATTDAATVGSYAFTVRAVDDLRQPVSRAYTLTVTAAPVVIEYLLLESGEYLLLESGDNIILD